MTTAELIAANHAAIERADRLLAWCERESSFAISGAACLCGVSDTPLRLPSPRSDGVTDQGAASDLISRGEQKETERVAPVLMTGLGPSRLMLEHELQVSNPAPPTNPSRGADCDCGKQSKVKPDGLQVSNPASPIQSSPAGRHQTLLGSNLPKRCRPVSTFPAQLNPGENKKG